MTKNTKNKSPSTRGRSFTGKVISAKAPLSATIEWERLHGIPKYERHEKRRSRVHAENPETINAEEGDMVEIKECRPLSKTKKFIITKILEKNNTTTK